MNIVPQKRIRFGPIFQGLVGDPNAKHYHRIKQAIWFYLYLIAYSNLKTGKLIASLSDVSEQMGIQEDTISSWLGHLKKLNYVTSTKQDDKCLFRITKWKNIFNDQEVSITNPEKYNPIKGRFSRKNNTILRVEKATLSELGKVIAEELKAKESVSYFEHLCQLYPKEIVLKSFKETIELPSTKIKKTRSALFVYLVKKYAQLQKSPVGN